MTIDVWHHRHYAYDDDGPDKELRSDAPSTYETFPFLAEVLATRDPSRFRPTLPPRISDFKSDAETLLYLFV